MNRDRIMEIVEVQAKALTDEKYLQLYEDYSAALEKVYRLMKEISPWEREIVNNYLLAAVSLHDRLMELAIDYGISSSG